MTRLEYNAMVDTATAAPASYEPSGLQHAFVFDGKGGGKTLDWAGVEAWKPADGVLWVNLDYSTADVERWLDSGSRLDPITREALRDIDPRPRVQARGDDLLVILRGINTNAGANPEDMISVRAYVEPRRVITLRRRASRSIKSIAQDLERGTGPRDAADFVAMFAERIVEHIVTGVDTLGDAVAACEDQVLVGTRGDLRGTLADVRRRAIALRRFLAPQREALAKLTAAKLPWFDDDHRARAAETLDRMTRTLEELDAARDRAAVTQEELASRLAEVTNARLYVLSLLSAVFLPLGFVCSLLGVNVGGVPLQHSEWAFWALCGLFAIGVACTLWLFKRRGWLWKT
jgi:zinc transporter